MADKQQHSPYTVDPHITDPQLLRDNTHFKSYKTSRYEYPELRIFYRPHVKTKELCRDNGPLPLLVFIPGLGGSVAQFHPLLASLVDLAPCLAIDYPGGGRSGFEPKDWDAYSADALNELFETVIEDFRDREAGQTVVLIGHSMGTARAAWLANTKIPHTTSLASFVVGLIAICPISGPPAEDRVKLGRRLMWVPGWIFDLWRTWDGMGGLESPSVWRFVGPEAEPELRALQYRFNKQSRTPVWRRMFYGLLPTYEDGKPVSGLPGLDIWAGLEIPVYLIAAEKDKLTPPEEIDKIMEAMKTADGRDLVEGSSANHELSFDGSASPKISRNGAPQTINEISSEDFTKPYRSATSKSGEEDLDDDPSTPQESPAGAIPPQPRHPRKIVKSITIPAPATHAVLYMPRSVRALAGLVSDFLATNVTGRLSLGWQLQYLSREGKWDVKNLDKWKSVKPVSEPIGPADAPVFRAMKTLREADEIHCPDEFVTNWAYNIKDIVDISKDQPVYDPRGLEREGITYHKFPTVSKIPPQADEVEAFIQLIDSIRKRKTENGDDAKLIGVHCHYGYNRTGYFIVCYLVEKCGMGVKEAIEEFARRRPNGIRHSHFLDRLYVRYNVEAPRS